MGKTPKPRCLLQLTAGDGERGAADEIGSGLKHKRKRSFSGMEALALLTLMANLQLVWFRRQLGVTELGIKRFIEEVLKIPGKVVLNRSCIQVTLEPQFKYSQVLNYWRPQRRLPLFRLQSGTMLYKT
jgi:hypothetical protein